MCRGQAEEAIDILDDFKITNELFREHLIDLCMNKKAKEAFDKLSTQQKSAFTRAYNKDHKDPTAGKRAVKGKAATQGDDAVSDSDDEKNKGELIEEDEAAEMKRARARERLQILEKKANKIDKFEMIKPTLKGEPKVKVAAAKKGKAKTQAAKKKGKGKSDDDDDSLDGFVVADDDDDAVKP